jgi:hypothetical protein
MCLDIGESGDVPAIRLSPDPTTPTSPQRNVSWPSQNGSVLSDANGETQRVELTPTETMFCFLDQDSPRKSKMKVKVLHGKDWQHFCICYYCILAYLQ